MMRALFAAAFVALAACSGGFGDRAREEFHAAVDAGAGVTVHVDNIAGSVNVGAWPRPSVDVRATKYGRDAAELRSVKIDVRRTGGDVYVKTSYEGLNHGSVRYRLSVPDRAGPRRTIHSRSQRPRTCAILTRQQASDHA